jgi:hypothetical protein
MIESVEKYLQENPSDLNGPDSVKLISEHSHLPLLEAVVKTYFIREINKKHVVWLKGPKNCGKSAFIKLLSEIFVTQRSDFVKDNFTREPKSNKDQGKRT